MLGAQAGGGRRGTGDGQSIMADVGIDLCLCAQGTMVGSEPRKPPAEHVVKRERCYARRGMPPSGGNYRLGTANPVTLLEFAVTTWCNYRCAYCVTPVH